jgi:hypothetical protein
MKALPILVMTLLVTLGTPIVEAIPKAKEDRQAPAANDPLIGTQWDFLGVKRQRINGFKFLKDGRVRCESTYKNATWMRLDGMNILFSYGVDDSFIVFRISDQNKKEFSGHHYSGRRRYLSFVK